MWGRVPLRQPRHGRASLAPLHPALAGDPPNGLAGAVVDQCIRIVLGQAARPCLKSFIGELHAFRVRVVEGSAKLLAAPAIQLVPDGLGDELAAVLLTTVDVSDEVVGQGDGHTFEGSHRRDAPTPPKRRRACWRRQRSCGARTCTPPSLWI